MSNRSETFGRLLKGAINSIAAYEGKTAPAIEDELGEQIGVAGSTIQRYKAGYLPTEPRVVQILAEAAVRRGYLSRAWLLRFLQSARYPSPDALLAQLADTLGPTGTPHDTALPSGMLAFLFTDIEGSTTLWEQQGPAMERALARHDQIMRQTLDAYGGQVFNTAGDAFHAVFTTVTHALDAALAVQRALAAEAWGPIEPIRVRMALHVGMAQQRDGDYFGQPLNRIARLCAAGHGGQILLSNAAQELVRDALPKGTQLRDLGEHRLKDLARPERIFQIAAPDLPSDFPTLRTLESYTHNLPAQATALIGREREVHAVCALVRRDHVRLLTLTGPGGTGKTRLALQAAADLLDDFRDGVYFVALAPIRDPEVVTITIAQVLGVKEEGDRSLLEQIKAYLHQKQMLLLLDNFEQVAPAGSLVAELLAAAPALKVMITSREVLHLYGEHEYSVPPLSLPDIRNLPPIERLTQYEAVRLFIERAQAVRPDFAVTAENAPAIAEICTRLDGLPLAIELAAARSKLFPPKALLVRLDKRLAFLTGGARDLPARQQTLRSAIAWSYDLLDAAEQAIFARLGVFAGGCTFPAATAVLSDEEHNDEQPSVFISPDVLVDGLVSLVDKSLLKQVDGSDGEPRFVMLETLHEFARTRLEEQGEIELLQRRHALYCLALVEMSEPKRHRALQGQELAQLAIDHDNLRGALGWSSIQPEPELWLKLAAASWWFWYFQGYWSEGYDWLRNAVNHPRAPHYPAARAKALYGLAAIAWVRAAETGDYATALACAQESVSLYRPIGDRHGLGCALFFVGLIAIDKDEVTTAQLACDEALQVFRQLDDTWWLALTLNCRGIIELFQREFDTARSWLEESLALWQVLKDKWGLSLPLGHLARIAYEKGDSAAARQYYEQVIALRREIGDRSNLYLALNGLGYVELRDGHHERAKALFRESLILNHEFGRTVGSAGSLIGLAGLMDATRAARWLGAASRALSSIGAQHVGWDKLEYERNLERAQSNVDERTFVVAWVEGQQMRLDEVIAEALALTNSSE